MKIVPDPPLFSHQLEAWLNQKDPKTIKELTSFFAEKSFAFIIIILMIIPALPIPAAGINYILESLSLLIATEMIIGVKHVWVPQRWRQLRLPSAVINKTIPWLVRLSRRCEQWSKFRWASIISNKFVIRIIGLIIFLLTLACLLAPPLTGLDTIPALGVVIISLALILENTAILLIGLVIGLLGVGLEVGIGDFIVNLIT